MLFIIILLVAQFIANVGLVALIRYLCRKCNISLSIHNTPIVIFWIVGLTLLMWLSIVHTSLYIMGGFCIALIMLFGLIQTRGTGETITSILVLSIFGFMMWAQLLTLMVFYATHKQLIDENTELR